MNRHINFNESFEDIQKAFSYNIFTWDPEILVENIVNLAKKYLKQDDVEQEIVKAYKFALDAHWPQKRLSGEQYITHPLKATEILLRLHPDIKAIQACILHDVIEDTEKTYEDICSNFGQEVADLCEGLSKVSNVRYTNNENQLETIKKTFLAMAKDLRVIFIKLADRIHNIQTLHFHPKKEKQIKIATETMKIYVPIAKRLWLFKYAVYLENWSFKTLNPERYNEILKYYGKKYHNVQKHIQQWTKTLSKLLEKQWIKNFSIKWRIKSPYRIQEKLNNKYNTTDFDKVLDILAFRIVTDSISNCYSTLWLIHWERRPIINKIKDYIAIPKFNGYQSLHTTILWMFSFPVEIQIRTNDMDEIAEFGVAAHSFYAEKWKSVTLTNKQSKWMKELQSIVSSYTSFSEQKHQNTFKENLNIELLHKNIFVYTPKWDIIEIPQNATVLDFAFRVHTDVWLRFKNVLVNGVIKPINFIPKTWDIITVNTFRNKYVATKYRKEFLHTPSAKNKLTRFLKEKDREKYISDWKEILEKKLLELWLPNLSDKENKIVQDLSQKQFEKCLIEIADKQKTPRDIIKKYYPDSNQKTSEDLKKDSNIEVSNDKNNDKEKSKNKTKNKIIIDFDNKLDCSFCALCKPKIWDKIIAKTWINGIKIHKTSCSSVKKINFDKLLEAHWKDENISIYKIKIWLEIKSENWWIISLMSILNTFHLDMENISFTKQDSKYFKINLDCIYKNPSKMWIIINELEKNPNIKVLSKEIL